MAPTVFPACTPANRIVVYIFPQKTRFHPSIFLGLNHALHSQCLFLQRNVDQLFIVHTGKDDTWKIGGPLSADLDTALQNWPHHIVSLQGSVQNNIVAFLDRNHIDLVVLGEDFPRQGGFQIASVADWVKSNVGRPFIIIRQSAVRNERLRLSGDVEGGFPGRSISLLISSLLTAPRREK